MMQREWWERTELDFFDCLIVYHIVTEHACDMLYNSMLYMADYRLVWLCMRQLLSDAHACVICIGPEMLLHPISVCLDLPQTKQDQEPLALHTHHVYIYTMLWHHSQITMLHSFPSIAKSQYSISSRSGPSLGPPTYTSHLSLYMPSIFPQTTHLYDTPNGTCHRVCCYLLT